MNSAFETPERPTVAPLLQGASNFRDVGGYPTAGGQRVKRGHVFRSDHLAGLSEADVARLKVLGVRHSLDFRGTAECTTTPYAIEGIGRVALTIEPTVIARMQALVAQGVVPTTEETVALMCETYRDFVNRNADTYSRFMKHLLEQPTPQVFHCTAGKDRTGFAAALLLSALGVDRATITHDYLLTNQLYKRDARLEGQGHPHVMKVLWQVQPEFLNAAFDAVDNQHGGMQNYLHGAISLSPQELAELQKLLLED
ncbi:tyrosine-protein phosphatase [Limnohabitans sp. 15K]|uniref:tyrosine-protein phosphatase n=1 Tax=Limnohabitans sp. 15K TaxID=1100706 RepID=UPI000C1EC2D6|nr:tyrosine-protein phosphatase [Limnohabitans sp. 15K]PIT83614.1 protein tyrosine phosphatase [Limnohabitans sp. 15K]